MKNWKAIIGSCMFTLFLALLGNVVSAEAGTYLDWEEIEHYDVSSMSEVFESVAVIYDEEYAYIHLIQKQDFKHHHEDYMPHIHDKEGRFEQDFRSDYVIGETEDGRVSVEIRIPLDSAMGEDYFEFDFDNNGEADSIIYPSHKDDAVKRPEKEEEPEYDGNFTIVIDGYYQDWEGIPHNFISNGRFNPYQDKDSISKDKDGYKKFLKNPKWHKQLAMVNDGEYVYIHIKTSADGRGEHLNGKGMSIEVDGKVLSFDLCDANGKPINGANLKEGTFPAYLFTSDGKKILLEDCSAYVTIADEECDHKHDFEYCHKHHSHHRSDECEIAISFETLSELLGVNMDEFGEIKFTDPNTGTVTNSGSSSGPIIGISICAAISCLGFVTMKRKKKA